MPKTYTMMVKENFLKKKKKIRRREKKKVRKEKEIVIDHLYFDPNF